MLRHIFLVFCLVFSASGAMAAQYHCQLDDVGKNGNWLDPDIVIEHSGEKTATIRGDGVAAYFSGNRTTTAKVSRDTDRILVVTWDLKVKSGTSASNHNASYTMHYRASVRKKDNVFKFTAKPLGYNNSWYSSGTCTAK